jgi:murein DD-endopeptidase MepM/ murein hydrolase activator NlpD
MQKQSIKRPCAEQGFNPQRLPLKRLSLFGLILAAGVWGFGGDAGSDAVTGSFDVFASLETRRPIVPYTPKVRSIPPFNQTLHIKRGGTLSGLLRESGIKDEEAHKTISALGKVFNLRRIRSDQPITLTFRPQVESTELSPGVFLGLSLNPDALHEIAVKRTIDGFSAKKKKRRLNKKTLRAEGVINNNLFDAASEAGLPVGVLISLIHTYSWDVDFQRDIRRGDRFEVLYERLYDKKGEAVNGGDILFASLTLSGKPRTIYRHIDAKGKTRFFDETGRSARRTLMRTPIDGARLSSRYGRRRHPVLGYTKVHRGVDFAAARGTPIYAAGDGTITAAGRNGSYGQYIRIRHNSTYDTAYAHMSRIATRKGRRVKQGQVIGYVGTTGRSTGPHLHYEILANGRKVNPLKISMPSGNRLKGNELAHFQKTRRKIDESLMAARDITNTTLADSGR